MKTISHFQFLLKNSTTKIIEDIPEECASCGSPQLRRAARLGSDRRFGIARRYKCGTCYKFTLVDESSYDFEQTAAQEPVRNSIESLGEEEQNAEDLLYRNRPAVESQNKLASLRIELDSQYKELERLRSLMNSKEEQIGVLQAENNELIASRESWCQESFSDQSGVSKPSTTGTGLLNHEFVNSAEFIHALYLIGLMYAKGRGVEKNEQRSLECLITAAKCGHASAQYSSGIFLLKGIGCDRDPTEGKRWLNEAANQDHKKAKLLLRSL